MSPQFPNKEKYVRNDEVKTVNYNTVTMIS